MTTETRKRMKWVQLYNKWMNYTRVSLYTGVSRPTLRKWVNSYKKNGVNGLLSKSRRPKNSPKCKVDTVIENRIKAMRIENNFGTRRIQSELLYESGLSLSLATIHKVLTRLSLPPIKKI